MNITVPMTKFLKVFGVSATVTRPAPHDTPVQTTGIWEPEGNAAADPMDSDIARLDPQRVMALPVTDDLPNAPKNTLIVAAAQGGDGPPVTWRVQGYVRAVEADVMRVYVIRAN